MGTLLVFGLSYLVSLVMIRVDGHVWLTRIVLGRCRGSGPLFLLALMVTTLSVSAVLPNMMAVVMMTPLVALVARRSGLEPAARDALATTLVLGVLYGANLGGVASMVGSPSNAITMGAMLFAKVPHLERLTFMRWLAFGTPIALVFIVGAWVVLRTFRAASLRVDLGQIDLAPVEERNDLRLGGGYILLVASVGLGLSVTVPLLEPRLSPLGLNIALGVLGAALGGLPFFLRLPDRQARLLRPLDLFGGLPLWGVGLAIAAVIIGVIVERAGWVDTLAIWLRDTIPNLDRAWVIAGAVFGTILLSEFISNIGTAVALWPISAAMLDGDPTGTFLAFLGIGLSCNCCFMSPLATPAGSMAFGATSGVSLRAMLGVGLIVDLWIGTLITASLLTWIPWVLGL